MDISIILLTHNEGLLVHRTVMGIEEMRLLAREQGVDTEVIVMMDNASEDTKNYFYNDFNYNYQFYEVSFGECGSPRNEGVKYANGKYVAVIDGDDIFTPNYLLEAFKLAEVRSVKTVFHAEYAIVFGEESNIWKLFNQDSVFLNPKSFFQYNPYHSMCFANRTVFLDYPYRITKFIEGYGFEDWDWNLRTIEGGCVHEIIPDTAAFIRRKKTGSLVRQQTNSSAISLPNTFFERNNFLRIVSQNEIVEKKLSSSSEKPALKKLSKATFLRKIYSIIKPLKKFNPPFYFNYKIDSALIKLKEIFLLFIPNKGVKNAEFFSEYSDEFLSKGILPQSIIKQMKLVNEFEPEIRFSNEFLTRSYKYIIPTNTEGGEFYYDFCKEIDFSEFHLFFIPWLKMGGADLLSIRYINEFIEQGQNVVVVITEDDRGEWLDKVNKKAKLIFTKKYFHYSNDETVQLSLTKVIQHFNIKSIHIINSKLAYGLYDNYGKSIKKHAPLYVHLFCKDVDVEGNLFGYAFECFFKIHTHVTHVITENKFFIKYLCEMYGYSPSLFKCIYQPIDMLYSETKIQSSVKKEGVKILWAGRFDKQKRPELLIQILELLKENTDITVDIYGKKVLNDEDYIPEFKKHPFVKVHKPYSNWEDIAPENFDVFLYTSSYDGMPNIVLEAISRGLIIIAPNIGGISEIVEHNKTGFLIDDDITLAQKMVEHIFQILENKNLKTQFHKGIREKIIIQHSLTSFKHNVGELISQSCQ